MKAQLKAQLQGMQQQVQQLLAQARGALDQRTARERKLLLGGGAILLVLVLYLGIWEPMLRAHQQRSDALESARALAVRIETAAALVQSQGPNTVNRQISILSAVDQSSHGPTLGKEPSRVQPDGSGEKSVKVWFEDVSFDNLLRWLGELQTQYAITVGSAEIERGSAPGAVSVSLTLTR